MRVGDTFVADVNRFARPSSTRSTTTSLVVQEALGTLNNSSLAREAVEYAYDHGVTVIASAADEAAQHHNWPSTCRTTIVVNSVTAHTDDGAPPADQSYLAVQRLHELQRQDHARDPDDELLVGRGRASAPGWPALIYSAALNAARARARSTPHPDCVRAVDGRRRTARPVRDHARTRCAS